MNVSFRNILYKLTNTSEDAYFEKRVKELLERSIMAAFALLKLTQSSLAATMQITMAARFKADLALLPLKGTTSVLQIIITTVMMEAQFVWQAERLVFQVKTMNLKFHSAATFQKDSAEVSAPLRIFQPVRSRLITTLPAHTAALFMVGKSRFPETTHRQPLLTTRQSAAETTSTLVDLPEPF